MSRIQYLKSLERDRAAAAKVIDELTRENYELRQMLRASTRTYNNSHEAKPTKDKAY